MSSLYRLFEDNEVVDALMYIVSSMSDNQLFGNVIASNQQATVNMIQSTRTSKEIVEDANLMKSRSIVTETIIPDLIKFLATSGESNINVIQYTAMDVMLAGSTSGKSLFRIFKKYTGNQNMLYAYLIAGNIKNLKLKKYLSDTFIGFDYSQNELAAFRIFPMDEHSIRLSMSYLMRFMSGIFGSI